MVERAKRRRHAGGRGPVGAGRSDRGTVLMVLPAAMLVILFLGAVVLDSAVEFMAQRNLASAAADASNDLGNVAIDQAAVLGQGKLALNQSIPTIKEQVQSVLHDDGITDATINDDEVVPTSDGRGFRVTVHRQVQLPFWAPGTSKTRNVQAIVTVTDVES